MHTRAHLSSPLSPSDPLRLLLSSICAPQGILCSAMHVCLSFSSSFPFISPSLSSPLPTLHQLLHDNRKKNRVGVSRFGIKFCVFMCLVLTLVVGGWRLGSQVLSNERALEPGGKKLYVIFDTGLPLAPFLLLCDLSDLTLLLYLSLSLVSVSLTLCLSDSLILCLSFSLSL